MTGLFFLIFFFLFLIAFGAFFWLFNKKTREIKESLKNDQSLLLLQNQLNELSKTVDLKLHETHQAVEKQLGVSTKIVQEVTEKLTKLDETNKQVINFAEQLQRLEDILQNPKQRGVLGEYYLETVLKNVLPPKTYALQYRLGQDDEGQELIVDAVIFVKDKIIPIDSKFSLENYNRLLEEKDPALHEKYEKLLKQDLKKRIDETAKYIRPRLGTMDFAFMFIPSEALFYDLLINQVGAVKVSTRDLLEYAYRDKHVIITSPTSLLAYLQTVLQGLRALQIEETTKEIRKGIEDLRRHLLSFEGFLQKLGVNLSATVNAFNSSYKEFKKIDKDIVKINGGESRVEPLQIDKPNLDV